MRSTRVVAIVLILMTSFCLINWVRDGDWPIVQTLPLLGGYRPGLYDLGAAVMALITIWGIMRLGRGTEHVRDSYVEYDDDGGYDDEETTHQVDDGEEE